MSTVARSDARIKSVEVSDEMITARLVDGRIISVPLAWSWRLAAATPEQRANYQIIGDGQACTGRTSMRTSARLACLPGTRRVRRGSVSRSVASRMRRLAQLTRDRTGNA